MSSVERHQWLEDARVECSRLLAAIDCNVPDKVRVTIGFPSTGGRGRRIGECWSPAASSDEWGEIFVSPRLSDSVEIMGVMVHELIHAAVGTGAKHGAEFKAPTLAVGLEGKMTATKVSDALRARLQGWIDARGPYPAGSLNMETRKKQTTRLLKAECETCGYVVRVTNKWVVDVGPPHCPDHGAMAVDGVSEEDPEEGPDLNEDPEELSPGGAIEDGYTAEQEDPKAGAQREYFSPGERGAAEAKARQWSKTGAEKTAHVRVIQNGEEIGHKVFFAGIASPHVVGTYPLPE